MNEITFRDLIIKPTRISVQAVTESEKYDLWFEFSDPIPVTSTSVAVALSTLCGRAYSNISFDFAVAEKVLKSIYELTLAKIQTSADQSTPEGVRRGNLLSFSGGFDSLAARALMPFETNLVSMDFGGRFGRERAFFEEFDTLRVSTNIVETPLRLNSWSFMGIGAILAGDYYRSRYHTFGSILEAGADNMRTAPVAARNNTFPPFKAAGYTNAPYVLGLTEIGTLTAMLRLCPELVGKSLLSLASPGEEKLYRKSALARVVSERLGVSIDLPEISPPQRPHFKFGENFALDLLTMYVLAKTGDVEAQGLVREIPNEAIQVANKLSMNFMERANPTLFENFPAPLAPELHHRMSGCGIQWYTEHDWEEFKTVRDVLLAE